MSSKITIIGAGSVGSTIAYTLSNEDIASEIVLIDINKKKVEEFDWRREFALEGDKPVGIVRYKKRSKNSSITNR